MNKGIIVLDRKGEVKGMDFNSLIDSYKEKIINSTQEIVRNQICRRNSSAENALWRRTI